MPNLVLPTPQDVLARLLAVANAAERLLQDTPYDGFNAEAYEDLQRALANLKRWGSA